MSEPGWPLLSRVRCCPLDGPCQPGSTFSRLVVRLRRYSAVNTIIEKLAAQPGLMSAKDAAQTLGVHSKTLYELVKRHSLPAIRIAGRLKFDPAALSNYIQQRSTL